MTSSIPDAMSTADLQSLIKSAPQDSVEEMTPQQMMELVESTIEELTDKFGTSFGYKLTAIYALQVLFGYNNHGHKTMAEQGDLDSALCWARDAGQIQLMLKNLSDIYCGDQDFICPQD